MLPVYFGYRPFLSSLGRSGTHWLKFMIADVMDKPVLEQLLTDPLILDSALRKEAGRKLCYGHLDSERHMPVVMKYSKNLRMVFLYRNPLDVLISAAYFMYSKNANPNNQRSMKENLKRYIHGELHYAPETSEQFNAFFFYQMSPRDYFRRSASDWIGYDFVMTVRYEDLVADTGPVLAGIMDHLKVRHTTKQIDSAIAKYRFEVLSGGRRPGEEDPLSHFRMGIPGEHEHFFDHDDRLLLDAQLGDLMEKMGYERPALSATNLMK
jgi:sulfotransferase family protein